MATKIVSIVTFALPNQGHQVPYHISVGNAARRIGCEHVALLDEHADRTGVPAAWHSCLNPAFIRSSQISILFREGRFIAMFFGVMRAFRDAWCFPRSLESALKRCREPGDRVVLLMEEGLSPLTVLSCYWWLYVEASRTDRLNTRFWFLFRNTIRGTGPREHVFRWVFRALRMLGMHGRMKVLADSRAAALELRLCLGTDVTVMPIPHMPVGRLGIREAARPGATKQIRCWWPGEPRVLKGWEFIRALAAVEDLRTPSDPEIMLVLSEAAAVKATPTGIRVHALKPSLPRNEYLAQFEACDIVLLPYHAPHYRCATSGIFVEAIVAGKLPLVSQGSWMEGELAQFGLDKCLVIAADEAMVLRQIRAVAGDSAVREKLAAMRQAYLGFHSEAGFAGKMAELLADEIHGSAAPCNIEKG